MQTKAQAKIGKSLAQTYVAPGSRYFYNAPREEHVFVKYPCLRRAKVFAQFAAQYQVSNPQTPLKRSFTSVLGIEPVCEIEQCSGLYYWYDYRMKRAKWRNNPVFMNPLFILHRGEVQHLTRDSLKNFQLIEKYRGLPLYDSLLQHSDLLAQGQVGIAY